MATPTDELIAIASGTKAQVAGWSKLIRSRSIEFVIQTPCQDRPQDEPDHVELWVHKEDAKVASSILQATPVNGEPSYW